VNAKFEVLAERLIKLGEVILVLRDLAKDVHAFLDDVLANDLQDLILLKGLTGNVEREVLGVNDTFDEVEVFGYKILAIIHDEDAAHIKLDVVALFLGFEKIERSARETMSENAKIFVIKVNSPFGNE
jgi:hypothetical protein